jgi:hypothetical protein
MNPSQLSFTYPFGAELPTEFTYSFQQENQCGYAEIIEWTGLPSFVSHDESAKSLSIYTENSGDVGEHTIELQAKVSVPTDHTLSSYEEVTVQESITIVVGASC